MRKVLGAIVTGGVLVAVLACSGCQSTTSATPAMSSISVTSPSGVATGPDPSNNKQDGSGPSSTALRWSGLTGWYTVDIRICADPTGSTTNIDPGFPNLVRSELIDLVDSWPTSQDVGGPAAQPARPGLSLRFRWLEDAPLATRHEVDGSFGPVDGLAAEPNAADDNSLDELQAWSTQAASAQASSDQAAIDKAALVAKLKSFNYLRAHASPISACIAAVTAQMPSAHAVLIVFSDGLENAPAQPLPPLPGTTVIWVQPCPTNNGQQCINIQNSWTHRLMAVGARKPYFPRPETANADYLANLIEEGITSP